MIRSGGNMFYGRRFLKWYSRHLLPQTGPGRIPTCSCNCERMQNRRNFSSASGTGLDKYETGLPMKNETMDLNILGYIDSIQQSSNAAVLFSDAPPVLWTVDVLCSMKDLPGMTWISTIILGTFLIRASVGVPVAIAQNKSLARLEMLKPELKALTDDLKRETAMAVQKFKWDEKTTRRQFTKSYRKHWRNLVESNNCHPMKSLALSVTQLPFWICFSSAIRNIVYAVPLPRTMDKTDRWIQIHNEGTMWIDSLVLPDPIVFPAIFLVVNFLNIELNRKQRLSSLPETKMQKVFPWVIRGGIVAIAVIATSVPSALSMYWATSSTLAFIQNIVFASPLVKPKFKVSPQSIKTLSSIVSIKKQ